MTQCGPTHYAGCICHEERRDAEVAKLRAENERLRSALAKAEAGDEALTAQEKSDG